MCGMMIGGDGGDDWPAVRVFFLRPWRLEQRGKTLKTGKNVAALRQERPRDKRVVNFKPPVCLECII